MAETENESCLEGEGSEHDRCMDVARVLVAHLRASDLPEAPVWAEAIDWFRKRIKGGHLSIHAQQDFDERFGTVDWTGER
jgi:hypothetical protein